MTIHYKIELYSYWHIGSGMISGADADNSPLTDHEGIPFLPGKTLKGLLRDAAETLKGSGLVSAESIKEIFGEASSTERIGTAGKCYFEDAMIATPSRDTIVQEGLQPYLYHNVSSTALDENRQAKEKSLRTMPAVVPLNLYGSIGGIPSGTIDELRHCLGMVKKLGTKRNRGWGRCKISVLTLKNKDRS